MLIVITGAASGIGLSFVNAFGNNAENTIYAIDSAFPNSASGGTNSLLTHNRAKGAHIECISLDITHTAQVAQLGTRLEHDSIDLVVHSAGIRGLVPSSPIRTQSDVAKAENIDAMDAEILQKALSVNTVGTFLVLKALIPALLRSKRQPKVLVMSSRMGSLAHNISDGGAYAYRASKAGLNAVVKSFSVDVPEVTWVIVHPGRLETGLVAIREDGALSVDEGVAEILKLLGRLRPEDSGRFVDRFGVDIPW